MPRCFHTIHVSSEYQSLSKPANFEHLHLLSMITVALIYLLPITLCNIQNVTKTGIV